MTGSPPTIVKFGSSKKELVTAHQDGTVRIWNIKAQQAGGIMKIKQEIRDNKEFVTGVAFSSEKNGMVFCTKDGDVYAMKKQKTRNCIHPQSSWNSTTLPENIRLKIYKWLLDMDLIVMDYKGRGGVRTNQADMIVCSKNIDFQKFKKQDVELLNEIIGAPPHIVEEVYKKNMKNGERDDFVRKCKEVKLGGYVCGYFTNNETETLSELWNAISELTNLGDYKSSFAEYLESIKKFNNMFNIDFKPWEKFREQILQGLNSSSEKVYTMSWRACKNADLLLTNIIGVKEEHMDSHNFELCKGHMEDVCKYDK